MNNYIPKLRPISLISILFIFYIGNIHAQDESCAQTLVDAQEVFANGKIEEVPGILESCLNNGFNRQEKVAAYRLLTLCHLYYDRTVEASETMQELLSIQPEYKLQDIDPSEFINLHSTFRTTPLFIVGIKGGVGGFRIYDITNYNDINSTDYSGTYKPVIALMGGLSIEVPILKELSIATEIFYNTYEYTFEQTVLEYATIDFTENVSSIEIPVLLQWNILKDRALIPYINAGTSLNLLLSSEGNINREDVAEGEATRQESLVSSIDLKETRNKFNYALTAGAGVRIKDVIGNGYLTFDVRYSKYLRNNVNKENRVVNPSLTYSYLYTDNSFKKQDFEFLIGYKQPIYFARQRKASRPE